jgi:hypothetical protein
MPETPRTRPVLLLILVACAAGAIAFSVWLYAGMMRPPQSLSPAQLADPKSTTADVVLEVANVNDGRHFVGLLLVRGTASSDYIRTHILVKIRRGPDTHLVMGSPADLVNGAIIEVSGSRAAVAPLAIDAGRIVFLTGYVKVR